MIRLLGIIALILSLLLFPPATLALISNNAVPGDATYPIKRGLEDIIFSIASIHPVTKAWFAAARSDRRFEELNILVTQGKQVNQTLDELVEQTQIASEQIAQISDNTQKAQLIEKLSESIKKYDKGLVQLSPQVTTPTSKPEVQPTPTPGATVTPAPTTYPTIKPTSTPRPTITPGPTVTPTFPATPHPTSTPQPFETPTLPPPPSLSQCDEIQDPIERARCKLQLIQQGLGTAGYSPQEPGRQGEDQEGDSDEDEEHRDNQQDRQREENQSEDGGRESENSGNRGGSSRGK